MIARTKQGVALVVSRDTNSWHVAQAYYVLEHPESGRKIGTGINAFPLPGGKQLCAFD